MATRKVLSKKGRIILIVSIIIGTLVLGGSGYLLWRINQKQKLSSDEADAGAIVGDTPGPTLYCCRFKCCDGTWRAPVCDDDPANAGPSLCNGVNKDEECGSAGYSNCAGVTVVKCSCEKWSDSCGTNCTFPSGTQERVEAEATSACEARIAMCDVVTGKTTIEAYGPGQACYGKISQCKNPFAENPCKSENVCDGGAWTKQIPSKVEAGESVDIAGYGQDSDGVDPTSVSISVDGETVDDASASVDSTDSTKTNWSYTLSGLEEGSHTVTITWKDTKGLGGSSCTLTSTFTVEQTTITNPDWTITKVGIPECQEGETDELDKVLVSYTITVTNTGDGEGSIDNIVDTLDGKAEETFIVDSSISSSGVYTEGIITWALSGTTAVFSAGESKSYTYQLLIPRDSFGIYNNTVVATPTEGDSFSTVATINAGCTTEDIPQTGIWDDAGRKIFIGFGFLALGMLYMKFDFVKLAWNGVRDGKKSLNRSFERNRIKRIFTGREKFEKKIVRKK